MRRFTSAAVAALLSVPLAAPVAFAQDDMSTDSESSAPETPSEGSSGNGGSGTSGAASGSSDSGSDGTSQAGDGGSADASEEENLITDMSTVVVSVGETDITAGQVREMLSSLPSQAQGQPAELLVPLAVEELVMRELILQTARAEGLDESEEVQQLSNGGESENALENAMIRAYIGDRMEGAVTDESVQSAYDEAVANTEEEAPPLEEVRPQIEQQLQQRRLIEIRDDLKSEIDVVYYGPDGEPREEGDSGSGDMSSGGSGMSDTNSDEGMDGMSGAGGGSDPGDGSGSSDNSPN